MKLARAERRLFIEAACETLWVRVVTTVRSIRKYTSWLGKSQVETEPVMFDAHQQALVLQVKTAIKRCRHLVWARKCLVEAIAAKRMLKRRHIITTLYLGVARDGKGKLMAHAWLRSGDVWVSGGYNREKYTVVGMFS